MKLSTKEAVFQNEVLTRFELFKSLFLTLPFQQVKDTGTLLPFFAQHCEKGVEKHQTPEEIINSFFVQHELYSDEQTQVDLLFRFVQYIERQVVLFDAIEDSSFKAIGKTDQSSQLGSLIKSSEINPELKRKIVGKLKDFSVRLVLTAHPTQFYPGTVLSIINDLIGAIKENDIHNIHLLLQQLGKTPFINNNKPTPVDEAISLAWFLENVFYKVASEIQTYIDDELGIETEEVRQLIELGFWPGGDRDGNPNVSAESTKKVATLLRTILFRCYYRDFRVVKRRITFRGVEKYMDNLQELFYENSFNPVENPVDETAQIVENLKAIQVVLKEDHNNLFVEIVDDLLRKVMTFGCFFTTLDIRQDSSILTQTFEYIIKKYPEETGISADFSSLSEVDKQTAIDFKELDLAFDEEATALEVDTLQVIRLLKDIQKSGSERAAQRFIISNCQQASDILGLRQLFLWSGWKKDTLTIDFVPLFETVDDLTRAADVMKSLYTNKEYAKHLKLRGNKQTIMLGYSDSTKDGGYLMANWSIYSAKIELTAIAREYDVDLVFFDGRGGPPARGGGKTQRFYASMGEEIANDHIQLTIQGQTISSQYGSLDTARFNIEQLLHAGIISDLKQRSGDTLTPHQKGIVDKLADLSYNKFMDLRKNPLFLSYLENLSPLKALSSINISSRPVKRNSDKELKLKDLRAISFVTAWSQLKQNIPGFYGVGTALKWAEQNNLWKDVQQLYLSSGFFQTLIDNCMMSMTKSNFDITSYMQYDEKYGEFWKMLHAEFLITKEYLLKLSNTSKLMENYPIDRESILARENIVLPLLIIQHYAIKVINEGKLDEKKREAYAKLIARTIYGVVNAGRNVA
ncbi:MULTISPECIES: phosphoenolpyruvate carboxylase [Sphingobacterium]|jgi:phosphoenolpyruvate carboxylase|uniref:Phosphoenolpyruvate carboxylase n=2 Tax=Sphingobacterium TaxID=28453 RepID=A0ABW5Z429_9SPHI|nr:MULTISPECIES: phosphoenolpyruvate carboxylase [Sphingobacterium]MBB2952408.1 phosphoenolpyruvate carboxylase [Sphingobacterium sp. JUb56]MCS3557353.1 phosphoenolpyruvate carboxylase [Sphingobacterium sp. JUb21]MCW2260866.1 phosphoenolpyruvate carboxylase [Sphingobacterium kitahiroshimense]NJI76479.1 phosphoenolpyruvate carboxylase [Sphingobacterium sp. B16(2022)]TCR01580.1 phosphoenolpyruvate carboxylase type 1 [Sphingobacterium sp. JUb20]